jgi:hypothetical protein
LANLSSWNLLFDYFDITYSWNYIEPLLHFVLMIKYYEHGVFVLLFIEVHHYFNVFKSLENVDIFKNCINLFISLDVSLRHVYGLANLISPVYQISSFSWEWVQNMDFVIIINNIIVLLLTKLNHLYSKLWIESPIKIVKSSQFSKAVFNYIVFVVNFKY